MKAKPLREIRNVSETRSQIEIQKGFPKPFLDLNSEYVNYYLNKITNLVYLYENV